MPRMAAIGAMTRKPTSMTQASTDVAPIMRVDRDEKNVEVPQQSAAPTPPRIPATRAFSPVAARSRLTGCSHKTHAVLVSRSHRAVTVHPDTDHKGGRNG